jgi:LysM repeat protein
MADSSTYTVKPGDTLGRIASRLGTSVEALAALNALANVNLIRPGQVLKIPGGGGAPSPAAPSAPAPAPPPPAAPAPADAGPFGAANLALGLNAIFEKAIVEAARRTGMAGQTVAAIINAEAAKLPNRQWDANSKARTSSASGLTQFLDASWLAEARRNGGLLNAEARALGLVSAQNQVLDRARLMALRFDPRLSILAGADFARANLAAMKAKGVIGGNVGPAGLAKLAYVAHHEGLAGGVNVLKGNMGYVSQSQFNANVPASRRQAFIAAAGGNMGLGYRAWLTEYVDANIDVRKFMKDSKGVVVPSLSSFFR